MFDKKYETRLQEWSNFRASLETSQSPFDDVIKFYNQSPLVPLNTDPWDSNTWPSPWELLFENEYCEFSRVLGWCYSLQLTDRFNGSNFEIHTFAHQEKSYIYCLKVDNKLLGFNENEVMEYKDLPIDSHSQEILTVPNIQ